MSNNLKKYCINYSKNNQSDINNHNDYSIDYDKDRNYTYKNKYYITDSLNHQSDIFYKKYCKYKNKYLSLKFSQKGGGNINNIEDIYESIPKSGLYDMSLSEEKRVEKFKNFCDFLYDKTKNNEEILQLKRKNLLERKKLTDTDEYKDLVKLINSRGDKYRKIGDDFEKKVFKNIIPIIKKEFSLKQSDFILLKNPILYLKNEELSESKDEDIWETVGEIDSVIIENKDGANNIIAICEFKQNFDDIPDALFQIKRSHDVIKSKGKNNVRLNDTILDETYRLANNDNYIKSSLIFTTFSESETDYFDIQSKLRHYLINIIHLNSKINYGKIFKKLLKKQIYNNKLTGKKDLRYSKGVLNTIEIYKSNKLVNRIKII